MLIHLSSVHCSANCQRDLQPLQSHHVSFTALIHRHTTNRCTFRFALLRSLVAHYSTAIKLIRCLQPFDHFVEPVRLESNRQSLFALHYSIEKEENTSSVWNLYACGPQITTRTRIRSCPTRRRWPSHLIRFFHFASRRTHLSSSCPTSVTWLFEPRLFWRRPSQTSTDAKRRPTRHMLQQQPLSLTVRSYKLIRWSAHASI